jgi:plastocyanin
MGEVYEFKFDNVGEFPYYCDYHLMPMNGMMPMKARVTVVDDESRECNDNRATCENICCATTQHCSDEDPQLSPPTSLWQQFVAWIDALAGEKPRLSPDDPICVDNIEETEEEEIPTTCSDADGEDLFTKGEAIVTGEATLTVRDTCLSEWETLAAEHEAYQNLLNMIIEEGVITQDQLGDGGIILEAYCPTEVEFTFDPIMYQKAHSCEGSCSEGACIEKEEDPEPQTHRLDIQGAHQDLAINVGDTVTWTNLDSAQHTVTSDPETPVSIGSASLNQDETFSFTFDTPGTYPYHCTIHPGMTGTITVQ